MAKESDKEYSDEEILGMLATGVSLLPNPSPAKLPDSLELGLQCLQALSVRRTSQPLFTGRWEALRMLRKPIRNWWPDGLECLPISETGAAEGLISLRGLTSLCKEWAIQGRRSLEAQLDEIDERVMLKIWRECQSAGKQDTYTKSRSYLIENPVAAAYDVVNRIATGELHELVREAYEPLPAECERDGKCYLCPHCGDAKIWQSDNSICRNWAICEKEKRQQPKIVPAAGLWRVKRGIFSYVVSPGLPELRLYHDVCDLDLKAELWPGVDAYDLRISFSSEAWAVDMKQSREPYCLGAREARKSKRLIPAPEGLEWKRAFYVIPDYFYDDSFATLFCRGAKVSASKLYKWGIQIVSVSQFLNKAKENKIA
jgi:hypothetical protein